MSVSTLKEQEGKMGSRAHPRGVKKRKENPGSKPSPRHKKAPGWGKRLHEMKVKYRGILHRFPLGLCEIDLRTWRCLEVNEAAHRNLGMTRKEFLSRPILDRFSEESRSILVDRIKELIALKGDCEAGEYQLIAKDGRRIWLLLQNRIIYEKGEPARILTIAHDITARKEAEEKLRRSQQELEAQARARNAKLAKVNNSLWLEIHERHRVEKALRQSEAEAKRLAQENALIAEIGRIIGSTLRIEEVYDHFAQEVKKLIPFDRIAISLNEYENNTIFMAYVSGIDLEDRRVGNRYPFQGSLNQKNADTRCGLIIVPDSESRLKEEYPSLILPYQKGLRSMMAVPLISRDRVIGTLHFRALAPNAYTEKDLSLAQRIADQIAGAIANAQLFAERERAEEALRQSEERFRRLAEDAPLGISLMNPDWTFDYFNPTFTQIFGYTLEDLPNKMVWFEKAYPDPAYREAVVSAWRRDLVDRPPGEKTPARTVLIRGKDGAERIVDIRSAIMANGQHLLTYLDVTDRKRAEEERAKLEEKLRQAQKMEAIGTLAGGIAHDFNNILAAIIGYAEVIGFDLPLESQAYRNLRELLVAGNRAKDLVKQIMAFGRKGDQERKPLRIVSVLKETLKLLRASLPSTIEIRLLVEEEDSLVLADPTQIHQLIMNLCANAAQAMEENGGILEVRLIPLKVDAELAKGSPDLHEGSYVRLTVKDQGHGIPPHIMPRIFDPYFTTKEIGKGTGLGLAVVHGIVKGHGGAISVSTEVGKGTAFDIYLPKLDRMEKVEEFASSESIPMGQGERILLVDDEPALVDAGQKMLEHLGYAVEVRTSSIEALQLFRQAAHRFDLVLTDLTMPHLTGDRLAQEMIRIRPGIPIILCTGFSERVSPEVARQMGIREYLMKPLLLDELAQGVRRALDLKEAFPALAFPPKRLAAA